MQNARGRASLEFSVVSRFSLFHLVEISDFYEARSRLAWEENMTERNARLWKATNTKHEKFFSYFYLLPPRE